MDSKVTGHFAGRDRNRRRSRDVNRLWRAAVEEDPHGNRVGATFRLAEDADFSPTPAEMPLLPPLFARPLRGRFFALHGALVVPTGSGAGLIVCGERGAGKTTGVTAALNLFGSSIEIGSDECVLVDVLTGLAAGLPCPLGSDQRAARRKDDCPCGFGGATNRWVRAERVVILGDGFGWPRAPTAFRLQVRIKLYSGCSRIYEMRACLSRSPCWVWRLCAKPLRLLRPAREPGPTSMTMSRSCWLLPGEHVHERGDAAIQVTDACQVPARQIQLGRVPDSILELQRRANAAAGRSAQVVELEEIVGREVAEAVLGKGKQQWVLAGLRSGWSANLGLPEVREFLTLAPRVFAEEGAGGTAQVHVKTPEATVLGRQVGRPIEPGSHMYAIDVRRAFER